VFEISAMVKLWLKESTVTKTKVEVVSLKFPVMLLLEGATRLDDKRERGEQDKTFSGSVQTNFHPIF
jgi:hypothetical protein